MAGALQAPLFGAVSKNSSPPATGLEIGKLNGLVDRHDRKRSTGMPVRTGCPSKFSHDKVFVDRPCFLRRWTGLQLSCASLYTAQIKTSRSSLPSTPLPNYLVALVPRSSCIDMPLSIRSLWRIQSVQVETHPHLRLETSAEEIPNCVQTIHNTYDCNVLTILGVSAIFRIIVDRLISKRETCRDAKRLAAHSNAYSDRE